MSVTGFSCLLSSFINTKTFPGLVGRRGFLSLGTVGILYQIFFVVGLFVDCLASAL
jgi:hypothetical protein